MNPEDIKIALFKEDKKSDKAPDFKGVIELDGQKHKVVLWWKTSKKGLEYLSGIKDRPQQDTQNSYPDGTF